MHEVGRICGEVLCIDHVTLSLIDLNAMKMKIRNRHRINFIPRSVKIHTKQGIYTAFISVVGIFSKKDVNIIIKSSTNLDNQEKVKRPLTSRNWRSKKRLKSAEITPPQSAASVSDVSPHSNLNLRKSSHHGRKKKRSRKRKQQKQFSEVSRVNFLTESFKQSPTQFTP